MRTFAYDENPFTGQNFAIDEVWINGRDGKNYVLIGKKTYEMYLNGEVVIPIIDTDNVEPVLIYTEGSCNITPEIISFNVNGRKGSRNRIIGKKEIKVDENCEGELNFVFTPGMFKVCEYDDESGVLINSPDAPIGVGDFFEILRKYPDVFGLRLSLIVPNGAPYGFRQIFYIDINIPDDPRLTVAEGENVTVNRYDGTVQRYSASVTFNEISATGNEYLPMTFSYRASPDVVKCWGIIEEDPYVEITE